MKQCNTVRFSRSRCSELGRMIAPHVAFAEDTIKVGLLATLEGPFTVLGQDGVRGAELALNEAGYKAGGKKIEIIKGPPTPRPTAR